MKRYEPQVTLASVVVSVAHALLPVPLVCLLVGAPPFGLGNVLAFVASFFTFRWALGGRERRASKPEFDVAAARRQAHAWDLPFIEADGSVSWPPKPKDVQAHEEMHARRLAAQPEVDAGEKWATFYEKAVGHSQAHAQGCSCSFAWGSAGRVRLAEDSRCKTLRKR